MFFLTFILVTVLLPKASSLTCCIDEGSSCTSTQCSASELCGATRITSYEGGTQMTDLTIRSCAVAENCVSALINFGVTKTVINTVCCSADNCNNQSVPESPSRTPNGKKCFGCDGTDCTTIMNCEGTEDRWISTTASSLTCCTGQGSSCTSTQCSASELCGATRITAYLGGTQITDLTRRSCVVAENCVSASINNGFSKTVANTVCCSTDNCNNQNVPGNLMCLCASLYYTQYVVKLQNRCMKKR
ncbi:phospholipase A2 inhibitor and Ly6/PLAUR domain-containing protein-like isoform X1 [Thalassophryne amazonica]|uniref:phospholipase A2 inhibitor and Ly6/PLAUR domain-containing protein-like isoform X1 n=1 Tax=Thalassophryne amazonica TaxID=390379 RepID=UPI00147244AE|nr:phospholipase A2 inhibitor and Ly6/PLAUR domain-containing protein-like isoform X1 [Thalassophryne amazonica]